jgi:hypothetical protein
MRAGYVTHSLECLERRAVGKCCSNVLRSLRAYGVFVKAVRTCVSEKNDTAHLRSSQMRDNRVRGHIHPQAHVHQQPNSNTRACLGRDNARA